MKHELIVEDTRAVLAATQPQGLRSFQNPLMTGINTVVVKKLLANESPPADVARAPGTCSPMLNIALIPCLLEKVWPDPARGVSLPRKGKRNTCT